MTGESEWHSTVLLELNNNKDWKCNERVRNRQISRIRDSTYGIVFFLQHFANSFGSILITNSFIIWRLAIFFAFIHFYWYLPLFLDSMISDTFSCYFSSFSFPFFYVFLSFSFYIFFFLIIIFCILFFFLSLNFPLRFPFLKNCTSICDRKMLVIKRICDNFRCLFGYSLFEQCRDRFYFA